jgi:hypothetical protein
MPGTMNSRSELDAFASPIAHNNLPLIKFQGTLSGICKPTTRNN